jgi:hypothetical protein
MLHPEWNLLLSQLYQTGCGRDAAILVQVGPGQLKPAMQPDRQRSPLVSGVKLRVREIGEKDLAAIAELLSRGFAFRSIDYWLRGLARHASRPRPQGYPAFGYCLDNDGRPVGVILLLFSEVPAGGETVIRCNISSWYVEPAFRTFAPLMVRASTKDKRVTYFNITPAPHTWSTVEAQGFSVYCKGQVYGALALSRPDRGAEVAVFADEFAADLTNYEADLLRRHAAFGCLSLVVHDGSSAHPFVFQKHYVKGVVPVYRLIYCREIGQLQRFAGNLGRFLARRGGLLVRFDANCPVAGVVGWYSEKRGRKYAKGPRPPLLGDLAFTEAALFDS